MYGSCPNASLSGKCVPVICIREHNDCNSYVKIEGSTNVNRFYFQQAIEDPKYRKTMLAGRLYYANDSNSQVWSLKSTDV